MAFTDRIYSVDWTKLYKWMIPVELRDGKIFAFIGALLAPVQDLYNRFILHRNYLSYWIEIDSQVWRMQKALNDKYDVALRRIVIVDAQEMLATPLYLVVENKPVTLRKKSEGDGLVLYTRSETGSFTVDFVVRVPADVVYNMTEMRAFVDTIKTPSKTYTVTTL